ncbi:MAG: hypothetical protein APF77_10940 [Clostridia bacterium BRH_c25]|nr:MAG: hypothetical protein APF77_10940 [Clostridia bacterium BRH_c25]
MNIKTTIKEIESKYKILKNMDFSKDLDLEKSDRFYIDKSQGYIQFMYKVLEIIEPDDYNLIYGEMSAIDGQIRLIPTLNDMTDNKVKRAHLLIEKKFNLREINVFDIKVKLNKNTYFFLTMNNDYSYELLQAQKEKRIFLAGEYYQSARRKVIYFMLDENIAMIEYEGLNQLYSYFVPLKNAYYEDEINVIINFKDNIIRLGENKLYFKPSNIVKYDEPLYLSLVSNSKTTADCDMETFVSRIAYGTADSGYLYFNPIITVTNIRVLVICKGNPAIEYFSNSFNKWLTINDDGIINTEGREVMLRARLSTEDKIYQILIAQDENN